MTDDALLKGLVRVFEENPPKSGAKLHILTDSMYAIKCALHSSTPRVAMMISLLHFGDGISRLGGLATEVDQ